MLKVRTLLPIDRTSIRLLANPQATMSVASATKVVADVMSFAATHDAQLAVRVRASAKTGCVFIDVDGDCLLDVSSVRALLAMIREWQSATMVIEIVYDGCSVSHTFHTFADSSEVGAVDSDDSRVAFDACAAGIAAQALPQPRLSFNLEKNNA